MSPSDPQEPEPFEATIARMLDWMARDQTLFAAEGGIQVSAMSEIGIAEFRIDLIAVRSGTRLAAALQLMLATVAQGPGFPGDQSDNEEPQGELG